MNTARKLTSIAALAMMATVGMIGIAGATKPADHVITICHRTDSRTNPYVSITVDVASAAFAAHEQHLGPIFTPALPKHTKWGDIIPPTSNDGTRQVTPRNWPAGAAILAAGCTLPDTTTTTVSTTTTSQPGETTSTSSTTTTTEPEGSTTTTSSTFPETTTTHPNETTTTFPETTTTGVVTSTSTAATTSTGVIVTEPTNPTGSTQPAVGVGRAQARPGTGTLAATGRSIGPLVAAGIVSILTGGALWRRRRIA